MGETLSKKERAGHHPRRTGLKPWAHNDKYIPDGWDLHFPGPLMSAKTPKDAVIRFIQEKCQECLIQLDELEQQYLYFFWLIMEHFCIRNGNAPMFEIALILFKGHHLLRKKNLKIRRVVKQQDWCLPLADLLCANTPEAEHRNAIIKMGDEFASRGWLYAAHICYVVAHMPVDSRQQFQLIGGDGDPVSNSALREAIERTEVYEYVVFLSSGFGQPDFQEFKFLHACELSQAGFASQALGYCESIAVTVLQFPGCIKYSEKLLKEKEQEEPEWLRKVRQVLDNSTDFSSSSDEEQFFSCNSELQESAPEFHPSQHSEFNSRYSMGELLGKGSFGSVYAGVRKEDGKEVAIKCLPKDPNNEFITIPGDAHSTLLEVALMEMVSKPPRCNNVVELLEWFQTSTFFILVLERPDHCTDLFKFCKRIKRSLPEPGARAIMWQVVQAARHCCDRGVLHRDIKSENLLFNPETLEVKLIDFGCGDLLTDEPYMSYAGTLSYCPPEWVLNGSYFGVPATIWGLGILLFELVGGDVPFATVEKIVKGHVPAIPGLSNDCCNLIMWCLEQDPEKRPTFDEILRHPWFKGIRDTLQTPPDDEDLLYNP